MREDDTALCPAHGSRYRILYQRPTALAAAAKPERTELRPGETCLQHPEVTAARLCSTCGQPICETCTFVLPQGRTVCPRCATQPPPVVRGLSPVLDGVRCATHPEVQATQYCSACHTPICPTCDFAYEGGLHLCPTCAANPHPTLSPRRQRNAIVSVVLAALATLSLPLLASEAAALLLILSVAGLAVALTSYDRHFAKPPVVWIGIIWNGVLVALFLLLAVVGTFMGGK